MGGKPSVEYQVITRQPTQEEIQQALAPRLEQLELSERKLRVFFFSLSLLRHRTEVTFITFIFRSSF